MHHDGIICGVHDRDDVPAAEFAASLAARLGTRLTLIHVREPGEGDADETVGPADRAARDHLDPGELDVVFESGETAVRLREAADGAELVVVGGTRDGVIREALHGSVTAAVTRRPPSPVVVVPPGIEPSMPGAIVCGVRDHLDAACVEPAAQLAGALGATLTLVHVVSPSAVAAGAPVATLPPDARAFESAKEMLEQMAGEHTRLLVPPVTTDVRTGAVGRELAAAAGEERGAMLVVGASDRGPLLAAISGAASRYVVRHAPCPVLVCPRDGQLSGPRPA